MALIRDMIFQVKSLIIVFGLERKIIFKIIFQPTLTYSKLTIEILKQGVKYVQVNNTDTRMTSLASLWCLYC